MALKVGRPIRHTFGAWERLTDERLDPGDEWLTAWGMRAKTWGSEQEQKKYGGAAKEEVFQVMSPPPPPRADV